MTLRRRLWRLVSTLVFAAALPVALLVDRLERVRVRKRMMRNWRGDP